MKFDTDGPSRHEAALGDMQREFPVNRIPDISDPPSAPSVAAGAAIVFDLSGVNDAAFEISAESRDPIWRKVRCG